MHQFGLPLDTQQTQRATESHDLEIHTRLEQQKYFNFLRLCFLQPEIDSKVIFYQSECADS